MNRREALGLTTRGAGLAALLAAVPATVVAMKPTPKKLEHVVSGKVLSVSHMNDLVDRVNELSASA